MNRAIMDLPISKEKQKTMEGMSFNEIKERLQGIIRENETMRIDASSMLLVNMSLFLIYEIEELKEKHND